MSSAAISQAGFTAFLRSVNIPPILLPDNSPYITTAYDIAVAIVNTFLCRISPTVYANAVYNLGTDIIINIAQDPAGWSEQENVPSFRSKREDYKISGFIPGVLSSSSNAGTAESLLNPEMFKTLLMGDLQRLKTPWGRTYLAIAANMGTNWGIT